MYNSHYTYQETRSLNHITKKVDYLPIFFLITKNRKKSCCNTLNIELLHLLLQREKRLRDARNCF